MRARSVSPRLGFAEDTASDRIDSPRALYPPRAVRNVSLPSVYASRLPPAELDYQQIVADLTRFEGTVGYMYLDTRGFVTVGLGNMLKTVDAATELPFMVVATNKPPVPATKAQIAAAYQKVSNLAASMGRRFYKLDPSIELTDAEVISGAIKSLKKEFVKPLQGHFPDFDNFPCAARRVLIDMAYNAGVGGTLKLRGVRHAVEHRDWAELAQHCEFHTKASSAQTKAQAGRAKWRRTLLSEAILEEEQQNQSE
jgi:GH24 family phage-related lysozyme (muramidase)